MISHLKTNHPMSETMKISRSAARRMRRGRLMHVRRVPPKVEKKEKKATKVMCDERRTPDKLIVGEMIEATVIKTTRSGFVVSLSGVTHAAFMHIKSVDYYGNFDHNHKIEQRKVGYGDEIYVNVYRFSLSENGWSIQVNFYGWR